LAVPINWSTQQLEEFLSAVSAFSDETALLQGAVGLAAEALDAELGAVIQGSKVVASVGFPRDLVPVAALLQAVREQKDHLDVNGLGRCSTLMAPLDDRPPGYLMLARTADGGFDRVEASLLRAMGRSIMLAARMLRLVAEERRLRQVSERQADENGRLLAELKERQRLLERLGDLRRSISLRAPLNEVQDAIVDGARELIGDEVASLRLLDPDDPAYTLMVAHRGISGAIPAQMYRAHLKVGLSGRAILQDGLVVADDYESEPGMHSVLSERGLATAMSVPVREEGRVVGSLTVATFRQGRRYSQTDKDLLIALSEMANIALTEASMVAAIRHQAFHDSLTGLANRTLFIDHVEMGLARARRRPDGKVGLLFIDIDNFKSLNDTFGHAVGDEVLAIVGKRLMAVQRETDTAARLGGDEFAILIDEVTDPAQAIAVAERVSLSLQEPLLVSGHEVTIATSIGVAVGGSTLENAHSLLRNADLAMYHIKETEQEHPWTLFEEHMYTSYLERREVEADLRRALERRELLIHYQPVVRLETGRLSGVEALLRWNHPVRGMVLPGTFISVAEETGLIVPIGLWVLATAMRQARQWHAANPDDDPVGISVNLSARQLREANLAEDIEELLRAERFGPDRLTLEITETVLMQDADATVANLTRLREIGVRLAIDDFGTGYSSLGYLQRFSLDSLKIDQSFVQELASVAEKAVVARTIINLAQVLNLATVAEGIETEEQLEHLRQLGCQFGQGFLFSRPVPPERIEGFMRDGLRLRAAKAPGGGRARG
jgi:diguanylate cyclase (GGDEF)-like protein